MIRTTPDEPRCAPPDITSGAPSVRGGTGAAPHRPRRCRWFAGLLAAFGLCLSSARASETFDSGLLWEVSRPGTPPSFLFGTMHVADTRVVQPPALVDEAFAGARTFVLELYPDRAVARRFSEGGLLDDGRLLSQLVPAALFARIVDRLAPRGLDRARVDRFKPWAALLMVTAGDSEGGASLDVELYARARLANKRVEELDSVEEQLAVFDDLPEATQIALLQIAVDRHDALRAELEQSIGAYRRGDLAALMTLARRNGGASPQTHAHYALLEKKIIHDRSVVMAHRLQPLLRRGKAFVAIGALHLYGEKGVLRLLQDDGWQVRPVLPYP